LQGKRETGEKELSRGIRIRTTKGFKTLMERRQGERGNQVCETPAAGKKEGEGASPITRGDNCKGKRKVPKKYQHWGGGVEWKKSMKTFQPCESAQKMGCGVRLQKIKKKGGKG